MSRRLTGLAAMTVIGVFAVLAAQVAPSTAAVTSRSALTYRVANPVKPGSEQQAQSGAIVPGFSAETYGANDDGSYPCTGPEDGVPDGCTPTPISLPFPVTFYGNAYSTLYLNNNGNLTFGQPLGQYTPQSLNQIDLPMIAPFWADVDTRTGPTVTFGYGNVDGHAAFGVNWLGVGCYDQNSGVTDSFQLLLIDRPDLGSGQWQIEFNYGPINWDSGQASGGDSNCLGGTAARAGYTSGLGPSCELRGSGINNALLSSDPDTGLTSHSLGSTVPGRFVFTVSAAGQPSGCHGYVAVGDSYSSGVGTLDYYKGKPCFQSNYAWPYYLSKNFPAAPQVDHDSFFACSGDNSAQLLTGKTGEPVSQLTQLQNWVTSNGDPALVTLTDGGDDLHFGDLLATCVIAPLPICEGFLAYEELYLEFGGFKSTLQTTLQKFVSAAGNSSKLVLVGYPNLFPAPGFTNDLVATVMCPWTKLAAPSILSDFEFAQGLLNSAEQQVANADHVRFIELGDLFNGNESCTRHPLIQGVLSGLPNPFHPDQTGQSIMANFIGGQLGYLAGNGSGGQVQRHGSAKSPKAKPAKTGAKPEVKSGGKPGSARPAKDQPAKAPAGPAVRPRPSSDRASAAPSVNAGLADGQAGAPYLGFLWATGGTEPISWSVTSGSLPSGLSLDGSSGIISGTPTASGSSHFTVTATDSSNPAQTASASESITIDAAPALAVQSSSLPEPTVGQQYQATVSATGGMAPYTWSVSSGSLPAGLSLDSSTGNLTGTPTASGAATFTIKATDSATSAATATQSFTLTVASATSALATASPQLPDGSQGSAYAGALTSTGGKGPLFWTVTSGNLPDGLSLDPGTGQITGVATGSGNDSFTVQVSDSSTPAPQSATEQVSIKIAPASALSIVSSSLADGAENEPYAGALFAKAGVAPYSWQVDSGELPDGLSLDQDTGMITGTPTTAGTFSFDITVEDSSTPNAQSASVPLSITIAPPPPPASLTATDTTTDGTIGAAYNASVLPAGGTGPYTFAVESGSLPDGLSLDSQEGTITGTPTTAGSFSATIQVTDSSSPAPEMASDDVSITIAAPAALSVSTSSLADGNVGAAYAEPVAVTGGTGADTFAVTNGALPDGLSLDQNSGIITGVPTGTGPSSFTVTVTDSSTPTPQTASADLSITTDPALPVSVATASLPDAAQNIGYSAVLAATGGTAPYTWSVSSGSLPDGLSLDSTSGAITGTPTGSGQSTLTVQVTDSSDAGATATADLTLQVDSAPGLTVTTAGLSQASQGNFYSDSLDTDGGSSPVTWSVKSGSLPDGLSLDPDAGTISGTPTGSGTSRFTIEATDSSTPTPQTATADLSIEVVPQAPAVQPQTISFTAPSAGVVGQSATLSATGGGSGNPVVFTVDGSSGAGVCNVNGTTVRYTAAGNCVIDANQAGDDSFSAAPQVRQAITVGKASTSTRLTLTGSPAAFGHEKTVVFTATVSPQFSGTPAGTITVKSGTATLCSGTLAAGSMSCSPGSASAFAPGKHAVTATYSGSAAFTGSTSAAATLSVVKAVTTTKATLSASTVHVGHEKSLVITVTVKPKFSGTPGGTITITAGIAHPVQERQAHQRQGQMLASLEHEPARRHLPRRRRLLRQRRLRQLQVQRGDPQGHQVLTGAGQAGCVPHPERPLDTRRKPAQIFLHIERIAVVWFAFGEAASYLTSVHGNQESVQRVISLCGPPRSD